MPNPIQPRASKRTPADARNALAAEQHRMRHYRKALACVEDPVLRARWQGELEACRERAAQLAIVLAEAGEPLSFAREPDAAAACLLDAMDMALCNGDMSAAEVVARECMALVDAGCVPRRGRPPETPRAPSNGAAAGQARPA